jgi:hypothetical protein
MEEKPKNGWEGINLLASIFLSLFIFGIVINFLKEISDFENNQSPIEEQKLRIKRKIYKIGYMEGQFSILENKPNNFKKDSLEFEKIIAE